MATSPTSTFPIFEIPGSHSNHHYYEPHPLQQAITFVPSGSDGEDDDVDPSDTNPNRSESPQSLRIDRDENGPPNDDSWMLDIQAEISWIRDFLDSDGHDVDSQEPDLEYPTGGLGRVVPPMSRSDTVSITRSATYATTATVISSGVLLLSLSELCDLIDIRSSLANADILSVECYAQRVNLNFVLHRFLILHLRRQGRKDVYLRMDRRADGGVSLPKMMLQRGQTAAHDEANLSPTKSRLIGATSKAENCLRFGGFKFPKLGELKLLLDVIREELLFYKTWPVASSGFSTFEFGGLMHITLAKQVRMRIHERIRLMFHQPQPPTITRILKSLKAADQIPDSLTKEFGNVMKASVRYDQQLLESSDGKAPSDLGSFAEALSNFNRRLASEGKGKWAILLGPYTIQLHRDVPKSRTLDVKTPLTEALYDYYLNLRKRCRMEEAKAAIDEAVVLRTELYVKKPDRHRGRLLEFKVAQYTTRSDSRDPAEAVGVSRDAIRLGEMLNRQENGNRALLLGRIHRHHAQHLSQLLRFDEARREFEAALQYHRPLARGSDDFDNAAAVATDLYFMSDALMGASRPEEALVAIEEALEIWDTELADDGSSRSGLKLDYTNALSRKAAILNDLQRFEEACEVDVDVIARHQDLHNEYPVTYPGDQVASAQDAYGDHLWSSGRFKDAIEAWNQSLATSSLLNDKRLAQLEQNHDLWLERYCLSLNQRRITQGKLAAVQDQIAAAEKCSTSFREAPARISSHYAIDLASYLREYGTALMHVSRSAEASEVLEKAETIYWKNRHLNPFLHDANLSEALYQHSIVLANLGQHEDATLLASEAVSLIRPLYTQYPNTFKLQLALRLLRCGATQMWSRGNPRTGIELARQSVKLLRELYIIRPLLVSPELARALWITAQLEIASGKDVEARDHFEEAIRIYDYGGLVDQAREMSAADAENRSAHLADVLYQLGWCLQRVNCHDLAIEALQEAQDIYLRLSMSLQSWHHPALARSALALAECALKVGRPVEGVELGQEAMSIFKEQQLVNPGIYDELVIKSIWVTAQGFVDQLEFSCAKELLESEKEALERPVQSHMYPEIVDDMVVLRETVAQMLS
ncbi:hypothetical protein DL93DRAFT_2230640 [Clavulina sp. PMI_390]|nr:hypothetical protein DL93DRAFT_2230640 [Clavulina sp. PMI_390]